MRINAVRINKHPQNQKNKERKDTKEVDTQDDEEKH